MTWNLLNEALTSEINKIGTSNLIDSNQNQLTKTYQFSSSNIWLSVTIATTRMLLENFSVNLK